MGIFFGSQSEFVETLGLGGGSLDLGAEVDLLAQEGLGTFFTASDSRRSCCSFGGSASFGGECAPNQKWSIASRRLGRAVDERAGT